MSAMELASRDPFLLSQSINDANANTIAFWDGLEGILQKVNPDALTHHAKLLISGRSNSLATIAAKCLAYVGRKVMVTD